MGDGGKDRWKDGVSLSAPSIHTLKRKPLSSYVSIKAWKCPGFEV